MLFDNFESVEVSPRNGLGFVYILCWREHEREIPFYVGQTQAILGRMNDYHWGDFQASTDFRVGEAIKYLSMQNLRVVARYKQVAGERADWMKEEREIIATLEHEGWQLLNSMKGYKYSTSSPATERPKIEEFVEEIRRKVTAKTSSP